MCQITTQIVKVFRVIEVTCFNSVTYIRRQYISVNSHTVALQEEL